MAPAYTWLTAFSFFQVNVVVVVPATRCASSIEQKYCLRPNVALLHFLGHPTMATVCIVVPVLFTLTLVLPSVLSIRCYQCSSDENKQNDLCGAYARFDTNRNTMVDCLSNEADIPGTFCYKSIRQGPRGFIWDGRWRTVERRCAQVSERGISWGCDWGYDQHGVYWEKCYCAEDGCNSAPHSVSLSTAMLISCIVIATFVLKAIF